jgi:quercetin dioxygenase-like cupin family protein
MSKTPGSQPETRNPKSEIQGMQEAANALEEALGRLHIPFNPESFHWEGIIPRQYKLNKGSERGMGWRGITRYGLGRPPMIAACFALRYFEIEPGGYSSLEKHAHVHLVIVIRGEGKALVGQQVFIIKPFDILYVPGNTPHRWINEGTEPFGFLCPVDTERDKPQPVSDEEWDALRNNPETAPYTF